MPVAIHNHPNHSPSGNLESPVELNVNVLGLWKPTQTQGEHVLNSKQVTWELTPYSLLIIIDYAKLFLASIYLSTQESVN